MASTDIVLAQKGHLKSTMEVCPLVAQIPAHDVHAVLVISSGLRGAPVELLDELTWKVTLLHIRNTSPFFKWALNIHMMDRTFFADPESGTILVIVAILRPKLFLKLCFLDATVWLGGKIKPSVKPSQVWRKLFSTTDAICLLGIDTSNDVSLAKIKSSGPSSKHVCFISSSR